VGQLAVLRLGARALGFQEPYRPPGSHSTDSRIRVRGLGRVGLRLPEVEALAQPPGANQRAVGREGRSGGTSGVPRRDEGPSSPGWTETARPPDVGREPARQVPGHGSRTGPGTDRHMAGRAGLRWGAHLSVAPAQSRPWPRCAARSTPGFHLGEGDRDSPDRGGHRKKGLAVWIVKGSGNEVPRRGGLARNQRCRVQGPWPTWPRCSMAHRTAEGTRSPRQSIPGRAWATPTFGTRIFLHTRQALAVRGPPGAATPRVDALHAAIGVGLTDARVTLGSASMPRCSRGEEAIRPAVATAM